MLPPQLRQTRGLRQNLRPLTVLSHTSPTAASQACGFSYWHKQRDWPSPLDANHERYMHRRRVTLKAACLRQQQWEKIVPVTIFRIRSAAYSKRSFRRSHQEDDEDDSKDYSRSLRDSRKARVERIRHKLDSDREAAASSQSSEPFWKSMVPDFLKQELAWQTPVEEVKGNSKSDGYAESRSFSVRSSQQAGFKPDIQASSTSWDSQTNSIRKAFYDPISGRMVEEGASSEEGIDKLTASDVRATMGRNRKAVLQKLAVRTEQLAEAEEDYHNKKSFDTEHDELVEARKTLEKLRAQVQILERRAHASTLTRPEDADDAERPAVFEEGWNEAPQGMQIAFANETEAASHGDRKSLEQEMHALNSAQVEEINDGYAAAPLGMQTQYKLELAGDTTSMSLEQEMDALNREPIIITNDGYSTDPKGMQTSFEKEQEDSLHGDRETLEQEYGHLEKEMPYDDGYSTAPSGMQTAYQNEDADSLEKDLAEILKRKEYDDGYSTAPSGMQTAYAKEDVGTLEQELNHNLERKEYDDGYSHAPIGMQILYQKEDDDVLEKELNEKLKRKEYDDGYSTAPSGMQTAYLNEEADHLERELREKLKQQEYDDGYSTAPSGMQTAYQKEDATVLENHLNEQLHHQPVQDPDDHYSTAPSGMQTAYQKEADGILEKELGGKIPQVEYDDGYSKAPKGMQNTFEREEAQVKHGRAKSLEQEIQDKLQTKTYDDGYSTKPSGLETAFNREQQHSTAGTREVFEQGMKSKLEETPTDSGYATMPIGLQVAFKQKQLDRKKSLEDELKAVRTPSAQAKLDTEIQTQKNISQDHDDGYSRATVGMQDSFRNEQSQQEQMQGLPGEGDLCTNVGKFSNRGRWYKQSALNNVSEDIQKAQQQRAFDHALVRDVRGVYEDHDKSISTEHHQPRSTANIERKVEISKKDDAEATATASTTGSATPATKWAEPAIYKVVAYDVHKEAISITTTPSNFSNSDIPMSISSALSRLHQPARFIPHFAKLQKGGYQVINASRDWLVLRKVDQGDEVPAQETIINPIDPKITRRIPYEELPTGRFASPTGFVNDDPIYPPEPPQPAPGETVTVEIPVHGGPDLERHRHRRVRREEPIFSGSKRWRDRRRDGGERREKRRFRDRAAWALSVGLGTAACMYVVGIVGELAKGDEVRSRK